MRKKILILIVFFFLIVLYFIFSSDQFQLFISPSYEKLSSGEIEESYNNYLTNGQQKELAGDFKGAILEYKKAIKVAPGSIPARNNLADCCIKVEDYECAEKWYLDIIKQEYVPNIVIKLSKFYKNHLKDNNKAVDILLSAHDIFPHYSTFVYELGFLYRELGDQENALKYLNKALEIRPDDQNIKDLISDLEK